MTNKTLDLGQTRKEQHGSDDYGCYPCGPGPVELSDEEKAEAKKKWEEEKQYPTFYVSNRKGNPQIPMEGVATIRYKIHSKTTTDTDDGTRYSMDIEVQEFTPEGAESEASDSDDIDKGLDEASKD